MPVEAQRQKKSICHLFNKKTAKSQFYVNKQQLPRLGKPRKAAAIYSASIQVLLLGKAIIFIKESIYQQIPHVRVFQHSFPDTPLNTLLYKRKMESNNPRCFCCRLVPQ